MENLIEIAKYVFPSLVVFATAYYMLQMMLARDDRRGRMELLTQNQKLITPIRLQAYERMVLFLERISPESLIARVMIPNMTAKQLQKILVQNIRKEFEHNLSQQIYISTEAWEAAVNAKENIIQLINVAGSRAKEETSALELSKKILDMSMHVEELPLKKAINFLKNETAVFMDIKRNDE